MKNLLPIASSLTLAVSFAFGGFALGAPSPSLPTYRFDMGTDDSPVASGFVRVTAATLYSAERKYGWESRIQEDSDVPKPAEDPTWHAPAGQEVPREYLIFKEHDATTRDSVTSDQDLLFRVDLPNGKYRVALKLGRLDRPVCSLQIFMNDEQVATDFDAKHWKSRRRPDTQYGFPRSLRHTVTVNNGLLKVRIHGDDSGFRKRFDQEYDKPSLGSYLEGTYFDGVYRAGRKLGDDAFDGSVKPPRESLDRWGTPPLHVCRVWVWEDIGGPFTENSVCSLEIYPHVDAPLELKNGQLVATIADEKLQQGAKFFQAKRWADAEREFDQCSDSYGQALGYLWLAGRPEYEEEQRLLPKALDILNSLAQSRANDLNFQEHLSSAQRMSRAIHRFVYRGIEQRSYTELILLTGEVGSMQPDDPLYYKSLIYAGRAMYMIIPHRWTYAAEVGRQYFEQLQRAGFGDNRFVRWFLHDEWSSHAPDWLFPDYSDKKRGAPQWAAEIFEAYNRELDLAEWWIRNRQAPDGSLGGGWGDDVEILRSIGAFASICPDASPLTVEGIRKLVDGVWLSGSIDQQAGYFAEVADTEHSAEWTADTLPLMLRLDYGNPIYVERAMLTGKLMRDVWMDYSEQGQRLMRSNYLGATGVGHPGTSNDSRINFRATAAARSVLGYNQLESLQKLFIEWADTWLAASMSSDRGKPAGIVPQEIGFPGGLVGGERSPNWYTAEKQPGTGNYDWEGAGGYHFYLVDTFTLAYRFTGDAKYLLPLKLQAEFVERHLPPDVRNSVYVRQGGRLHPSLWEGLKAGSDEWIAAKLATWPALWNALSRRLEGKPLSDQPATAHLNQAVEAAAAENEGARRRWPHTTTEAMATDRVHFPNMGSAVRLMTGFGDEGQGALVSYRGLGRNFAAVLLRADSANVRLVLYNMDERTKDASVVPWVLKQGDDFEVSIGPDSDNNAESDGQTETRKFRLENSGQEVPFRIAGRSQLVLDIRRTAERAEKSLFADVAITPADLHFRSEFGKIDVAVHNIGALAARRVTVLLLDDQNREFGRQILPHIAAPSNLDPQIVRVAFPASFADVIGRQFTVVLDPENNLPEITKSNNRATAVCPKNVPPRKVHSHP